MSAVLPGLAPPSYSLLGKLRLLAFKSLLPYFGMIYTAYFLNWHALGDLHLVSLQVLSCSLKVDLNARELVVKIMLAGNNYVGPGKFTR